ncbi:MAG: lipopolysaccharide export system protein LptC [Granulosicoccus sp.]|jgi:lipopolysaccharide export system protein LptC
MSKNHIIAITVLMSILCLVLWQSPPAILKELTDTAAANKPTHPDAFFINSKTIQYNEDGNTSHILFSERASYFEPETGSSTQNKLDSYTLLTQPDIRFYNTKTSRADNQVSWQASSDAAKSMNNNQEILMSGNVLLIQPTTSDAETATTIESATLLIKPDEQYAETDKPVIIKNASGVTTSTGLTLSLKNNVIELLSNVRSHYEPR